MKINKLNKLSRLPTTDYTWPPAMDRLSSTLTCLFLKWCKGFNQSNQTISPSPMSRGSSCHEVLIGRRNIILNQENPLENQSYKITPRSQSCPGRGRKGTEVVSSPLQLKKFIKETKENNKVNIETSDKIADPDPLRISKVIVVESTLAVQKAEYGRTAKPVSSMKRARCSSDRQGKQVKFLSSSYEDSTSTDSQPKKNFFVPKSSFYSTYSNPYHHSGQHTT
jgi:hypothetical protein